MRNSKDMATAMKEACKEWKAMNEKERSILEKKLEETRQGLEKWKQKVKADCRVKIIKDLESKLNQSLQFDKPKHYTPPNLCYYQQNLKSYEGSTCKIKFQESLKKWKT